MHVTNGHEPGRASENRTATFSGTVWADPVLVADDAPVVNLVTFQPGARTHWHSHEIGQLLFVVHGRGVAQVRDGDCVRLSAGDVVWFEAGEVHWHGADEDTVMGHTAVSLGTTEWLDAVADADYAASCGSLSD
jgi:quercetin dioxygenase-like cupin family protein